MSFKYEGRTHQTITDDVEKSQNNSDSEVEGTERFHLGQPGKSVSKTAEETLSCCSLIDVGNVQAEVTQRQNFEFLPTVLILL